MCYPQALLGVRLWLSLGGRIYGLEIKNISINFLNSTQTGFDGIRIQVAIGNVGPVNSQ